MRNNKPGFFLALGMVLIASELPNIIMQEFFGGVPVWLIPLKIVLLIVSTFGVLQLKVYRGLWQLTSILAVINAGQFLTTYTAKFPFLQSAFDMDTFAGYLTNNTLLKLPIAVLAIAALFLMRKRSCDFYLCKGNLGVIAEEVKWLIDKDRYKWGKLAVVSGLLVAVVTVLLTMLTVTGFALPQRIGDYPSAIPFIILFALINSLFEGIIYRNTVLGTLVHVFNKGQVLILAAIYFGIAHFYGAPGGYFGVLMASLLGWYLCRSMHETKGLLAPWIIHFFADFAIFTTFFLLGSFQS